jgi:hypothetical protein
VDGPPSVTAGCATAAVEEHADVTGDLPRDEEHDRGLVRADVGGDDDPSRRAVQLDLPGEDRAGVAAADLDPLAERGADRALLDREVLGPCGADRALLHGRLRCFEPPDRALVDGDLLGVERGAVLDHRRCTAGGRSDLDHLRLDRRGRLGCALRAARRRPALRGCGKRFVGHGCQA